VGNKDSGDARAGARRAEAAVEERACFA